LWLRGPSEARRRRSPAIGSPALPAFASRMAAATPGDASGRAAASDSSGAPTLEQVRALPKIELHAHLSGSVRQEFLLQLMKERGLETESSGLPFDCMDNLASAVDNCWLYFGKVAQLVTDLATLRRCALHVLECFAAEGCVYLEMRTSPKQFAMEGRAEKTSKEDYIRTVIDAIREFGGARGSDATPERAAPGERMEARLLISIDRTHIKSIDDARAAVRDTAALCAEFDDCVGIDICGNPHTMSVKPFLLPALLEHAKAAPDFFQRFPITCHTGETPAQEEETDLVIRSMGELNIRRLGHVNYLTARQRQAVFERAAGWAAGGGDGVGIELCPTSNMVLKRDPDLRNHHFPLWYRRRPPAPASVEAPLPRKRDFSSIGDDLGDEGRGVLVSINSDDTGLFSTSLSEELLKIASAFDLTLADLLELQHAAAQSSFHRDKGTLRRRLRERPAHMRPAHMRTAAEPSAP